MTAHPIPTGAAAEPIDQVQELMRLAEDYAQAAADYETRQGTPGARYYRTDEEQSRSALETAIRAALAHPAATAVCVPAEPCIRKMCADFVDADLALERWPESALAKTRAARAVALLSALQEILQQPFGLVSDLLALWPDLRMLVDGFTVNSAWNNEWDAQVRQRMIDFGLKHLAGCASPAASTAGATPETTEALGVSAPSSPPGSLSQAPTIPDAACRDTVPCGICGEPTLMTGTKRCDRCWELERRIKRAPEIAKRILGQQQAETAAGWRLVPVKPTPEMWAALGEWCTFVERAYAALLAATPPAPPVGGLTDELRQVAEFLDGTAPLDGVWFGERHPTLPGAFWWRSFLKRALAAAGIKDTNG